MQIELMEQIESTGKKNAKVALLSLTDEMTRKLITLALDPNITFGVTIDEDEALSLWKKSKMHYTGEKSMNILWAKFESVLNDFNERKMTGNAAKDEISEFVIRMPDEISLKWFCRVLNRNLRAGFDITTANKAWGQGSVKKFEVQLADTYEDQQCVGLWYFQPKLDGNRVVFIDGKAMSRNGKEYPNCEHVINEIKSKDPNFFDKWVLDGEMMGDLGFDQSSGALRRLNQKNKQKATFTYWAFDIIDRKEWENKNTRTLFYREANLLTVAKELNLKSMKVVPTQKIHNPTHKQIMDLCNEYLAQGFEGAMAKDTSSPYVFKRGSNLLKVKLFKDIDLRVVGFYEGKGKHKGRLGGVIVDLDGVHVKVGSGFDDATRDQIWSNQQEWIDSVVQVQYFEKTKDGSLRFPVFIMRRKDKE